MKGTAEEPLEERVAVGDNRHHALGLSDEDVLEMYRLMLTARAFDERTTILFTQGKIPFTVSGHGQEAAQVGAAKCLYRAGTGSCLITAISASCSLWG